MNSVQEVRLARLVDERAATTKLHDDLLSHSEASDSKVLTESQVEQLSGYRTRMDSLDNEIHELTDVVEKTNKSIEEAKRVRRVMASADGELELGEDGETAYRTFASYARDVILSKNTETCSKIAQLAGGSEVANRAAERLLSAKRTPANTLTSDVPGLIPEQHIAQIFQVIETRRPLVSSGFAVGLNRGTISFPKITQRPVVAVQTTQKTEAGNQKMTVSMETATASTYLGGGDLSWQAINWSTPDALDLWFALAAADYALKTEQDAGEVIQTAAFLNNISSTLGASPDFATFMTAVAAGLNEVYANSGDMADTLYLAPDRAAYLLGLTSATPAVFANGSLSFVDGSGNIAGLSVVISRGLDSGVIAVGVRNKLIVAETPGAPVELRVVEPAIGGVEVGIIGAFEAVVAEDEAFALLTTAS